MGMKGIPIIRGAALTAQMAIKMEPDLDQEVRMLKAHRIDVPEMVRCFLRREIPKIKKKLEKSA